MQFRRVAIADNVDSLKAITKNNDEWIALEQLSDFIGQLEGLFSSERQGRRNF